MKTRPAERRQDLVLAGRITGCFGIRGYLKLELAGGPRERAKKLRAVYVGGAPGDAEPFTVADVKLEGGRVLLLLKSVEDRTAAERLRGKLLFVSESDAAPPPPGGYYVHDIVGCEVRTAGGEPAGVVEDVIEMPAQHLWSVRGERGVYLIPAVREFIVSVDTDAKLIVVNLPDGLRGEQE